VATGIAFRGEIIMSRFRAPLSALLFLWPILIANAQVCPPSYVIVSALDVNGLPITDLAAANFRASHKGHPLNVGSASFRHDPTVRTIVLLDTSDTMGGFDSEGINKWRVAWSAASEFISAAPPQASISLFTFSKALGLTFRSSGGRQPIADWLNSREALGTSSLKGTKAFYKTLPDVLKEMNPSHPGDAIYLITDGREFVDGGTVTRAASELRSAGVRLFTFLLDDATLASEHPQLGGGEVSDLVQGSGGLGITWYPGGRSKTEIAWSARDFAYDDKTLLGIRATVQRMEIAITNFYVLTVAPPTGSSPDDWKLEVLDAQGKKRKDVFLAYPGKLQGCDGNTASH
jgi:hypothetical protein